MDYKTVLHLWLAVCFDALADAAPPQSPQPATAVAAPPALRIEPLDSSLVGLTFTGPDDPAFGELVAGIVPRDKLSAVAPFLAQSVILTNNSGQALRALCVRYTKPSPNGKEIPTSITISEPSFSKPVMAAGERRILPLREGAFEAALHGIKKPASAPPRAGPETLSVSIDLCMYNDWRVAGPDKGQHLARQVSSMRAEHDVCAQVGDFGAPGAAALASLEKEAAAVVAPPPSTSADWYLWSFQRTPERLLGIIRNGQTELARNYCAPSMSALTIAAALYR